MKHLKFFIFTFFFCCVSVISSAQNKPSVQLAPGQKFSWEEYKTAKSQYIVDCAKLSRKESEKFFPLYKELYQKKRYINSNARKLCKEYSQDGNITKQEYLSMIDSLCQAKIDIANLEKEYVDKFKKILPAEKLYKALIADENFDSEILKQMQKQKQE